MTRSHRDRERGRDRGLAFGIFSILLLGLGTFALVYIMVDPAASELMSFANNRLTGEASTGAGYAATAWEFLPFFAAALAGFALIARAVFEREGRV